MPEIKRIEGVSFYFNTRESVKHEPHIHIEYSGEECSISLLNCKILEGGENIKSSKMELL